MFAVPSFPNEDFPLLSVRSLLTLDLVGMDSFNGFFSSPLVNHRFQKGKNEFVSRSCTKFILRVPPSPPGMKGTFPRNTASSIPLSSPCHPELLATRRRISFTSFSHGSPPPVTPLFPCPFASKMGTPVQLTGSFCGAPCFFLKESLTSASESKLRPPSPFHSFFPPLVFPVLPASFSHFHAGRSDLALTCSRRSISDFLSYAFFQLTPPPSLSAVPHRFSFPSFIFF